MTERIFLKEKTENLRQEYDYPILKKALRMPREEVIQELKRSGLKGRGGAGFPTGFKWELAFKEPGSEKYIICNADEGEPGTFKDRYLLEKAPQLVLEGIMIAGYAVGADQGYIYIRGEYTNAIRIFEDCLHAAKENGALGENIFGSGFHFQVHLIQGAGAYVCGDETSLINSIEGERGKSRIKPPYPIQHGLFGKPTVVNNVETLSAAAMIIERGSQSYRALGTENSRGTKLLCLSGDIQEPGVYEVEFGQMTIQEMISTLGKGVVGELKFVIPGGVSTAILTPDQLDIPYTYEDIFEAGSGLGSGAMIVVNEGHDLLQLMLNVSEFFTNETCGTCFPCREGNQRVHYLLQKGIERGGLYPEEILLMRDLGQTMLLSARCGLGQTALCFIGSIIDHYQTELTKRR